MQTDDLLAQALSLLRPERARIAEELLASIEEPDDEVAGAWGGELERRSREVADGSVGTLPWESVREELITNLAERRRSE